MIFAGLSCHSHTIKHSIAASPSSARLTVILHEGTGGTTVWMSHDSGQGELWVQS